MAATFAAVLIASVAVLFASVTEQLNFSGEWILVSASEEAPSQPRKLVVKQDSDVITVERLFNGSTETVLYRVHPPVSDARPTGSGTSTATYSLARWTDGALVLQSGKASLRGEDLETVTERTETWRIGQDGQLSIDASIRATRQAPSTVKLKYGRPKN